MEKRWTASASIVLSQQLPRYISQARDIYFMLVGSDLSCWRHLAEAHWSMVTVSHRLHPTLLSPLLFCNLILWQSMGTMTISSTYLHDLNPNPWYHLHLCYYLNYGAFLQTSANG